MLALLVWAALRRPTGDRASAVGTAALLMGGLVVLSPVVHLWYLLWVVPFVATLRLSRLAVTALVAVSVIAGLVAPMDSSLHGAYYAIVLGSMIVAILAPVLLWTRGARERVERIASAHLPGLTDLVPEPAPRATSPVSTPLPQPRRPLEAAELSGLLRSFR